MGLPSTLGGAAPPVLRPWGGLATRAAISGGTKLFSEVTSASVSSTIRWATSFGSIWPLVTMSPTAWKSSDADALSDPSSNHSHIDSAIRSLNPVW